jgi:hypothetical protein
MAKSTSSIVKSLPSMLKNICFLVGFSSIQPQIVPCSTGADEKCKSCKGIRDRQALVEMVFHDGSMCSIFTYIWLMNCSAKCWCAYSSTMER